MATVAVTTVDDPVTSTNVHAAAGSGTTDDVTNTVSVMIVDSAGTTVGPITASVVAGVTWTIANADLSALLDGTLVWEATATATGGATAFAAKASTKNVGGNYVSSAQVRAYIGDDATNTNFASLISTICAVASRNIDTLAGRYFTQDAVVSARYFDPISVWECPVDDISTTAGLIVQTDDSGTGSYSSTWTLNTDFQAKSSETGGLNQSVGGITGYPYTKIEVLGIVSRGFFMNHAFSRRPFVKVTARWGWAAIPDMVAHATLAEAAYLFKMKDAADGFVGVDGWGPTRAKQNGMILDMLGPYRLNPYATA